MMAGLLEKLESNEAVLLMYLADELPAEDRAEVEALLSRDSGLRDQLERMQALQDAVTGVFQKVDAAEAVPADEAGVRRVLREMRRQQVEAQARPAPAEQMVRYQQWPRWSYVAAAMAASIFLFIGLWGFGVIDFPAANPHDLAGVTNPGSVEPTSPVAHESDRTADRIANDLERSFVSGDDETDRRVTAIQGERDDSPFLML